MQEIIIRRARVKREKKSTQPDEKEFVSGSRFRYQNKTKYNKHRSEKNKKKPT